jgi:hypothetical protein
MKTTDVFLNINIIGIIETIFYVFILLKTIEVITKFVSESIFYKKNVMR